MSMIRRSDEQTRSDRERQRVDDRREPVAKPPSQSQQPPARERARQRPICIGAVKPVGGCRPGSILVEPRERSRLRPAMAVLLATIAFAAAAAADAWAQSVENELRPASSFAGISEPAARSRALFNEAAKVLTSPRCMNCHPAGDRPTQGNDRHPHMPPITRGEAGFGGPGTVCRTCHSDHNFTLEEHASYQSIPGHPRWGLAPLEMAWQGKSIGEICRLFKDPARNGGRDLALLQEHAAHDDLVAWGWDPGPGRDPAPGTQQIFGELIQAWIDSGAECP